MRRPPIIALLYGRESVDRASGGPQLSDVRGLDDHPSREHGIGVSGRRQRQRVVDGGERVAKLDNVGRLDVPPIWYALRDVTR
jgi:hypothetical protein